MIDVEQTIVSQYSSSSIIVGLVQRMNDCLDPAANFDAFFAFVWDVMTAQGFGLDIWGRIVGVGRTITLDSAGDYFGFNTFPQDYQPFNVAPFYVRSDPPLTGNTVTLTDTAYRTLILVKALANISDCSARSVNTLLTNLFAGRGKCYVLDLGGMRIQYTFEFVLADYEKAILQQSGALLRPAGVAATIVSA